MNTTKQIKIFAALYLLTSALYLALSFWLESSLPPAIQKYLAAEFERESTQVEDVVLIVALVIIIFHLVSIFAIFREKSWAKNQFTYSFIGIFLVGPFFGVYIDHALSAAIGGVSTVIAGVIISLFFFTSSAFNKNLKPDWQKAPAA